MKNGSDTSENEQGMDASNPADAALKNSEKMCRRLFETAREDLLIIDADTGLIADVNPFLMNLLGYNREDFIGEPLWKFGPFEDIRSNRAAFQELSEKGYIRYKHLSPETRTGRQVEIYPVGQKRKAPFSIRDDSLPGKAETDPNHRHMKNANEKMSQIIGDLLSYAGGGKYKPETIRITDIVRECLPLLKSSLKSKIVLLTELPADLPKIYADKIQIRKALLAILQNSSEAVGAEGRIRIICSQHLMIPENVGAYAILPPGQYVCLTVKDTGHGMDEETRSRVFEPFFTTRSSGRGLGMAAVYGIVKNHNGWISVESQPNQETDVSIYLPAAASLVENPTFLEMPDQRTRMGLSY